MHLKFIQSQKELDLISPELRKAQILSVDTEFLRNMTYFAKLSIIQISAGAKKFIIDAIAIPNLSPIRDILGDTNIKKIFHAPMEDFKIFHHLFGEIPKNVFDTQLAAAVCGLGKSLSYSDLCQKLCHVKIDKTHQKANWYQRPLSDSMLKYAISDVEYLENIYLKLLDMMDEKGLDNIHEEKLLNLLKVDQYTVNSENAWRKIKLYNMPDQVMERLKILAAFREECSSNLDIPRQYFVNDTDLLKLCEKPPQTLGELKQFNIKSWILPNAKYQNQLLDLCAGLR